MTIDIAGLTPLQQAYADIFCSLQDQTQIIKFVASLPESERPSALTVLHLLVAEVHDQQTRRADADLTLARIVLNRFRKI